VLLITCAPSATANGESPFEDMSADMPTPRDIPMPEKIEVASSI
jgi:hypothetical protein